jgi:hypothetical protein
MPGEAVGNSAYLLDDGAEGVGLLPGNRREHLAVQSNVGEVQATDQLRVGEPVLARAGADLQDLGGPCLALLQPALAIGVLQPFLHPLDGDAEAVLGAAAVALGQPKDGALARHGSAALQVQRTAQARAPPGARLFLARLGFLFEAGAGYF